MNSFIFQLRTTTSLSLSPPSFVDPRARGTRYSEERTSLGDFAESVWREAMSSESVSLRCMDARREEIVGSCCAEEEDEVLVSAETGKVAVAAIMRGFLVFGVSGGSDVCDLWMSSTE